ncbi:hypothetical protein NB311A_16142 [Nitrobacter sp. Nb-311A]|nr:hypothetical protein NB311A_16142 [Nitrobacter sp. Nb-311A]
MKKRSLQLDLTRFLHEKRSSPSYENALIRAHEDTGAFVVFTAFMERISP